MAISDWEEERTVGKTETIRIKYVVQNANGDFEDKEAVLRSTPESTTQTSYETWTWKDKDGKEQSQDVVASRYTYSRTTAAAVNGSYVKWRLEKGLGLPQGDVFRYTTVTYKYYFSPEGPKIASEETLEQISGMEFAGSLAIEDYTINGPFEENGAYYAPENTEYVVSNFTRVEYEYQQRVLTAWDMGNYLLPASWKDYTKQVTKRSIAHGLTQEGQQSIAEQLKKLDGTDDKLLEIVGAAAVTIYDGVEVRTSLGRAQVQGRPDEQDRAANELTSPDKEDPDSLGAGESYDSGGGNGQPVSVTFDATGSPGTPIDPTTTETYEMPFAPDDYVNGDGDIVHGGAQDAAIVYGDTLNNMRAGFSYGVNITTSIDRLPSAPFAPVYLEAAGISAGMRLNGTSWAFDENGIVCSSDLFLCGVAGATEPVTTSWLQATVDATLLPILSS